VAQLQRFLELQRLGLNDKLQDSFSIPDDLLNLQVLPGCLLTLAENALKHGFKGRSAPYRLQISAEQDGESLLLQVKDNGRGFVANLLPKLGKQAVESVGNGSGVALYQLQQSLKLAFGEKVGLRFESTPEQGMSVSFRQPKRSNP
jgi:sensor histidine kinase YesM